jgi:biopolymer transport protein ExbB
MINRIHKSVLTKTFLLVLGLALALAVVVVAIYGGIGGSAGRSVRSQTLFEQFVVAGGWIVWFILLPMSFVTVYLAAEHSLTIRSKKLLPDGISKMILEIMQQYGLSQLAARISDKSDLVSVAVAKAVNRSGGDTAIMKDAMAEALQEQALGLFRKIEWLNLIGNVSPMVGLFGTVVGMIELFNAIVTAGGQPQPAHLAHGISVALVTTFWGLLIAIPALGFHGVFRNRIETLISSAAVEAEIILRQMNRTVGFGGRATAGRSAQTSRVEIPRQKPPIQQLPPKIAGKTDRPLISQNRSDSSTGET